MVRKECHLVVRHEVAGNGFAVIRAEEFGGCVPELAELVGLDTVKSVFEVDVALVNETVELGAVSDRREVERSGRVEDGRMLGEVSVVRVI